MAKLTQEEISYQRQLRARKSNDFIRHARYYLTLNQERVLLYVTSKIKPANPETGFTGDAPDTEYIYPIDEFRQVTGLKDDKYTTVVKALLSELDQFSIWVKVGNGIERFRWFDTLRIEPDVFKIRFHRMVQPYLFELTGNFTQASIA